MIFSPEIVRPWAIAMLTPIGAAHAMVLAIAKMVAVAPVSIPAIYTACTLITHAATAGCKKHDHKQY